MTWNRSADKDTGLVRALGHAQACHSRAKMLEPVAGGATQTTQCFTKPPTSPWFADRTAMRGFHDDHFVNRKGQLAKCVLAVALLKFAALFDGHRCECAHAQRRKDRSTFLAFGPVSIL